MTKNRIYELLETLPAEVSINGELSGARWLEPENETMEDKLRRKMADVQRYAYAYADLKFAWRYVQVLLRNGIPLPSFLKATVDGPVIKLYRHLAYDVHDVDVFEAMMLAMTPQRRQEKNIVNALLVSKDFKLDAVVRATGLEPSAIGMYEKLFFNVLDRRHEAAYMAAVVYPDGRMVEVMDNYLQGDGAILPKLLMRAGRSGGSEDVLYNAGMLAGLGSQSVRSNTTNLEHALMATGYMMARAGLGGQEIRAVNTARQLLAAAKAGGDAGGEESVFLGMGGALKMEMETVQRYEAEVATKYASGLEKTKAEQNKASDTPKLAPAKK